MMMSLGMFVFSLPTLAYQELQRRTSWTHASNPRVGARDVTQYTGPGDDTISLSGWIAPEFMGSVLSLDALRFMAGTGKSWLLVQGTGRVYGTFVITDLEENQTIQGTNGAPKRIDFTIKLLRTDESKLSMLDDLGDIGGFSDIADITGVTDFGQMTSDVANKVGELIGKVL